MRLFAWIKSISPWTICLFLVLGFLAYEEQKKDPDFLDLVLFKYYFPTNKVILKPYVITDEQVVAAVLHPEKEIVQSPAQELNGKNVNVILRFKKRVHGLVWGTVAFSVNSSAWRRFDVSPTRTYAWELQDNYTDYILPIGVFKTDPRHPDKSLIQAEWDDLNINDYK